MVVTMVTQRLSPSVESESVEWVLLSYRLPREPSTPRISVWRKLKALGVEQIGDGLVALPNDARTRERIEWVAKEIVDADGTAAVWIAQTSRSTSEQIANAMRAARDREYGDLIDEIEQLAAEPDALVARAVQRLRRTYRKIERRDYFRADRRDPARLAIQSLADAGADVPATS